MPNIRDIASLAGVSAATVSRVLNHHPYVSQEKREAVLKVMQKYNYQKNMNAVHLSTGKTFLIGVVLPFLDHPYFAQLVKGIANEALKHQYKLILFHTNYEADREIEALNMLKNKQVDALIICSRCLEWESIEEYTSYGMIVVCEDIKKPKVSSTFVNHYQSFMMALQYLYEKGHQRIGYCVWRKTGTNSRQREKAYLDFHRLHNLPVRQSYILAHRLYFEDGVQIVHDLRKLSDPPTALLVTGDQIAAGIVTCCKKENIAIPDQLAIIGFDNQPIAQVMEITTIEIPLEAMGRQLFLQSIDSYNYTHHEMTTTFIPRKTV
ncbi:LacI family DNA-binding transcriptional regulator [Bacillaceae bacterium SIJ1]|uniref:LacI family DNA-binding transcriptional regulator n=1 Tax=Litoribacterium kuwaitense TaxID=1398745 RepID=UPI0013ED1466|nr:LacI family DNA-binding transcriptional regulator [Litoribacterium kuwaitense]NGP45541.1 LacI family DNA-binding transcriptional regulator [Litoribacterium kuwaitense]